MIELLAIPYTKSHKIQNVKFLILHTMYVLLVLAIWGGGQNLLQLLVGKRGGGFKVIFFPYGSPLQISCKNSNKSGENKNLYIWKRASLIACNSSTIYVKSGQKSENKRNLGTKQYVAITQWRKISKEYWFFHF